MSTRTITNDRDGRTITTTLSDADALRVFGEGFGGQKHWLWYWLHKLAAEVTTPNGAGRHDRSIDFLADSFLLAIGMGLKRPMIRVHYKDQRFKFYLSAKGTICLKSGMLAVSPTTPGQPPVYTHDPVGDEFYVGCLLRGAFLPARESTHTPADNGGAYTPRWRGRGRRYNNYTPAPAQRREDGPERQLTTTEGEFLAKLRGNPSEFLAQCSKDMGRCCYCNLPLEDARSKAVGYGATCAKRWGLPWGDQTLAEKAPSFARDYDDQTHGLCQTVRDRPQDATAWSVFANWLEEHGLPRCEVPAKGVVLPRNDSNGKAPVPAPTVPTPVTPTPEAAPDVFTVGSDKLRYDAATKCFSVKASSIGVGVTFPPPRIGVKSHKTGKIKVFLGACVPCKDADGDVLFRDYTEGDLTLRVFND